MRIGWVLLFASVLIAAACWITFRGDAPQSQADPVVAPPVGAPSEGESIDPAGARVERNVALDATPAAAAAGRRRDRGGRIRSRSEHVPDTREQGLQLRGRARISAGETCVVEMAEK